MNIQSEIEAVIKQATEIKEAYPNVSNLWFEIKEIPYADFIAYCEEAKRDYDTKNSHLRAIAKVSNCAELTVWLYTKKLNIKKSIEVEEIAA